MRRAPAEERAPLRRAETPHDRFCGAESLQSETGEHEWMPRKESDGTKNLFEDGDGIVRERRHELSIRGAVGAELLASRVERFFERRRRAVVERMRDRRRRVTPLQSMLRERKRAQEWRDDAHRMNRRAVVVRESGKRQLRASRAAAAGLIGLEKERRQSGAREHDGRRKAVRSGTDDDGVVGLHRENDTCNEYRGGTAMANEEKR